MILRVKNLLDQTAQVTYLTQKENLAGTTLHVQNTNGASDNWALQVGKTGEEKSEVVLMSGAVASGTTFNLATATVNDHPTDTPVYAVKYDKIIWERSTAGTSGTAAPFATTVIQPDNDFTLYDDTSGAATYGYKVRYLNSATNGSSSQSDWITSGGYDYYSLGKMRQRIKDKLFSTGFIGEDDIIDDWINEYMDMMSNAAIDVNEDYNLGSTNVSFSGTTELGTISDTDFKQVRRVWMTADGVNYYKATKMESTDVTPGQVFTASEPYFFMYDERTISRWPHEAAGTACILYYKLNSRLSNETDVLPVSMQGYTKGFVDYALAQAKYKDNKDGAPWEAKAEATLAKYRSELTPRNKSDTTTINVVESVGDSSDFWLTT